MLTACWEQSEWPAKVAAAISAAVEFAIAEPESIRLLTVDSLIQRPDGGRRYARTVEHFAELLRTEAPPELRRPRSTEQALVGGIATMIADRVRGDALPHLRDELPELVEFMLLPYVGGEEARRWGSWAAAHTRRS